MRSWIRFKGVTLSAMGTKEAKLRKSSKATHAFQLAAVLGEI
jgi:hypothetical protein